MTVPYERTRAIEQTKQFLADLCDPKTTPRVPRQLRVQARGLLRHYPTSWDMERAAEEAPNLFAQSFEAWEKKLRAAAPSKPSDPAAP